MRERGSAFLRGVDELALLRDVLSQGAEAREHVLVAAEIRGEHTHERLVLDPRERGRTAEPLAERCAAFLGQLVMRPRGRASRSPRGTQEAEALEALRLGVPLTLGRGPVETAL